MEYVGNGMHINSYSQKKSDRCSYAACDAAHSYIKYSQM